MTKAAMHERSMGMQMGHVELYFLGDILKKRENIRHNEGFAIS